MPYVLSIYIHIQIDGAFVDGLYGSERAGMVALGIVIKSYWVGRSRNPASAWDHIRAIDLCDDIVVDMVDRGIQNQSYPITMNWKLHGDYC